PEEPRMVPPNLRSAPHVEAGYGLSPRGIGQPRLGVHEATARPAQGRKQPHVTRLELTDHGISRTRRGLRFAGIGQGELSGSGMNLGLVDHELCPQRGEPANARLVDLPQCPSAPISLPYGHSNHERSMFMKPTRTWILIADGARARILRNDGPGKGVQA